MANSAPTISSHQGIAGQVDDREGADRVARGAVPGGVELGLGGDGGIDVDGQITAGGDTRHLEERHEVVVGTDDAVLFDEADGGTVAGTEGSTEAGRRGGGGSRVGRGRDRGDGAEHGEHRQDRDDHCDQAGRPGGGGGGERRWADVRHGSVTGSVTGSATGRSSVRVSTVSPVGSSSNPQAR